MNLGMNGHKSKSQKRLADASFERVNSKWNTSVLGTALAQWLKCYATIRKVSGSIPASVSGTFIDIKLFRSHYGPGVDSASNRNEYQEYFLGVNTAGA